MQERKQRTLCDKEQSVVFIYAEPIAYIPPKDYF